MKKIVGFVGATMLLAMTLTGCNAADAKNTVQNTVTSVTNPSQAEQDKAKQVGTQFVTEFLTVRGWKPGQSINGTELVNADLRPQATDLGNKMIAGQYDAMLKYFGSTDKLPKVTDAQVQNFKREDGTKDGKTFKQYTMTVVVKYQNDNGFDFNNLSVGVGYLNNEWEVTTVTVPDPQHKVLNWQ